MLNPSSRNLMYASSLMTASRTGVNAGRFVHKHPACPLLQGFALTRPSALRFGSTCEPGSGFYPRHGVCIVHTPCNTGEGYSCADAGSCDTISFPRAPISLLIFFGTLDAPPRYCALGTWVAFCPDLSAVHLADVFDTPA